MGRKTIFKIAVDIGMTAVLLLLMAYGMVGEALHEWLGAGIFVLFVIHHILNGKWSRNVLKGNYTPMRIVQTFLAAAALLAMAGSMVSGVILSRHVFSFLPIQGGRSFARNLHMVSAYWGLVVLSLHLGIHWGMMMGMAKQLVKKPLPACRRLLQGMACLIAGYGIYAFLKREIGSYMLLKSHFVFFDFEEPLALFLMDYIAVMGLFVWIGHYIYQFILKKWNRKS